MRTAQFHYDLPQQLIAQRPVTPRDASRLLVIDKSTGARTHRTFKDLPAHLRAGDVLVRNDSRVMPARLTGKRMPTGGRVEVLLLHREGGSTWHALVRPGRRVRQGAVLAFGDGVLTAQVLGDAPAGGRRLRFQAVGNVDDVMHRLGEMPLPPYIHETLADAERYQTIYGRDEGSAAAPTAGLHFTDALLDDIKGRGVHVVDVTLHVGLATFRPVKAENVADHEMHAERFFVSEGAAKVVNDALAEGRRVIAVGTTAARALEAASSAAREKLAPGLAPDAAVVAGDGWTDLFIYPGYEWRVVDGLLTNFHLPRSSLLMLVSALLGYEATMAAYEAAVAEQYRFYSFGDAMLIV